MLAHRWPVSVLADIDSNELKSFGKDACLLQTQRQILGLTNLELTSHVGQCHSNDSRPAQDVVNDDSIIGVIIDRYIAAFAQLLPFQIHIMDERD